MFSSKGIATVRHFRLVSYYSNIPYLENYKKYIERDAIATSEAISDEVSYEERKINQIIADDISIMKNELACKMEEKDSRLGEDQKNERESIAKLVASENSKENIWLLMDQEFTEKEGLSKDDEIKLLVSETRLDLDPTIVNLGFKQGNGGDWLLDL